MVRTQARKDANKRYNNRHYDRIAFDFPDGYRARIKEAAAKQEKSMNRYVVDVVKAALGDE